jgi:glycosyltransferase involved in cell wall biosynthesis
VPLVSVVIPTKDRPVFLARALRSALSQSVEDVEIIVVDDGPSQQTADVVDSFVARRASIHLVQTTGGVGGAEARNVGVAHATGQWIAFLDDDDYWHEQKLERQLDALKQSNGSVASATGYRIMYPLSISRVVLPPLLADYRRTLLRGNVLGGASVCMCTAEAFDRIGGFDRTLPSGQDWDLWLRLSEVGRIAIVPEPLTYYENHFSHRISRDVDALYRGTHAFLRKHGDLMSREDIRTLSALLCYLRSRQKKRSFRHRFRYLRIATRNSRNRGAVFLSGGVRLVGDWVRRAVGRDVV